MCHFIHFVILDSFSQHGQSTLSISFWSLPSPLSSHTRLVFTARSTFCIYFFSHSFHPYHVPHHHVPTHIFCHNRFFPHHSQSSLTTLLCKHAMPWSSHCLQAPGYSSPPKLHQSCRLWLMNQLSMTNYATILCREITLVSFCARNLILHNEATIHWPASSLPDSSLPNSNKL